MRIAPMAAFAALAALAGCAQAPVTRDADGRPRLERAEGIATPVREKPGARDVIAWTKDGMAPAAIIERLRQASTRIPIDGASLAELRSQGVDGAVLDYLADADRRARDTDLAEETTRRLNTEARLREQQAQVRPGYRAYRPAPWGAWPGSYAPRFGTGFMYRRWP